jgi:hypothetical protein
MQGHIFVAYHDLDEDYAQAATEYLVSRGFEVHSDNGTSGAQRDDTREKIRTCVAFVPFISEQSLRPGHVKQYTQLATEFGKSIVALKQAKQRPDWLGDAQIVPAPRNPSAQGPLAQKLEALFDEVKAAQLNAAQISDITRSEDLLRYAVRAQLHHVEATVAQLSGDGTSIDGEALTRYLAGEGTLSQETLRALDDAIAVIGYTKDKSHVGGLAQFGMRMHEHTDQAAVSIKIPPNWTTDTLRMKSDDEIHVLAQATTLVNNFLVAERVGVPPEVIRQHHRDAITQVVNRLILLAGGPQTSRHIEAQLLLGSLAKYAFETVRRQLSMSIRHTPLGFRSWRSVTKLVMIARNNQQEDDTLTQQLRSWLQGLVQDAGELREQSIYPGRSLDLELFIAIPWEWGLDGADDLVTDALLKRAKDVNATLRERGTAAMGIWQRACDNDRKTDPQITKQLKELIAQFQASSEQRSDIANGLRWVATTLKRAMDDGTPVCLEWPKVDEPWYHEVEKATSLLGPGLSDTLREPTRELFRHALMQNAGVQRRRAIDTLAAGGLVEPVARQLLRLLRSTHVDTWLRVRALFALGFMQVRTEEAQVGLVKACESAANAVIAGSPKPDQITELQDALFAVGDVFGVTGIEDEATLSRAKVVRTRLGPILQKLIVDGHTKGTDRHLIARALAYMLIFTAQPGADDLSKKLLDQLTTHPDDVTREFSEWALSFRFGKDGRLQPLLRGIE